MDAIHEQRKQILTERGWAFQSYSTGGKWSTVNYTVYKDDKQVLSRMGYTSEEGAIDAAWTADTPSRRLAMMKKQEDTIKEQEAKIAELQARVAELESANARMFSTITSQAKAIEAHHDALRAAHWGLKTQEANHAE